jgi:hypothetical protein
MPPHPHLQQRGVATSQAVQPRCEHGCRAGDAAGIYAAAVVKAAAIKAIAEAAIKLCHHEALD